MTDERESVWAEHHFARGDKVYHVGGSPEFLVLNVVQAFDPDYDEVRVTFEREGKREYLTLSAWRLRKVRQA